MQATLCFFVSNFCRKSFAHWISANYFQKKKKVRRYGFLSDVMFVLTNFGCSRGLSKLWAKDFATPLVPAVLLLPPLSAVVTLQLGPHLYHVPAGSSSHGGDIMVYIYDINQLSLPTPCLFCSCVYFYLYGPFNCLSFHKFSWQLSVFSLCSFELISALLVLSTIYLFMKVFFSPDIILSGWPAQNTY